MHQDERAAAPAGWRHPGSMIPYSIAATALAIALSIGVSAVLRPYKGPVESILVASLVAAVFVAVYVGFCRWIEGRPARKFALRGAGIELASGIAIGLVLFSAIVGVIWLFGGYRVIGRNGWDVLLPATALAIMSGFTEEIFFRGFFFRLTERWLGTWAALALSAALFGALHLANPNATLLAAVAIML